MQERYKLKVSYNLHEIVNRPGVAGAVLQTPQSLIIDWMIN